MYEFFSYHSYRLIGIYAFLLGGKVMRIFLGFVLFLVAFGVNAQEAAEPAAAEVAAPAMEPMMAEEDSSSAHGGFFDSTLVDYWVESPLVSNDRHTLLGLLVRPIKRINDRLNVRLGLTFYSGDVSLADGGGLLGDGSYYIDDPYLMIDGLITEVGMVKIGGYLRYYIPISKGARGADRAAYFRGLLTGSVPVVEGINFGLNAEYRFYAYHGDGNGAGDRMRTTLYASLSGSLGGGFSFYTWHGIKFVGNRIGGGFNDRFVAYNESILYAKVGDSNFNVGVGLIEEDRPWDSDDRAPDTQNFLYSPHYTKYVLNMNTTF